MIKNIIFDIGNVLVSFDWEDYLREFGFDPGKEKEIAKALFLNPAWRDLDRGLIPLEELEEQFVSCAPCYREDILKVFRDSPRCIHRLDYSIPWICSLKEQGFKVYYLSNYSESVRKATDAVLDFIPYTDGGLFSYEVKQVKPEPEIFRSLMNRFPEITPEESVFFDDSAANVKAACDLGFHGIIFTSQDQAVEILKTYSTPGSKL